MEKKNDVFMISGTFNFAVAAFNILRFLSSLVVKLRNRETALICQILEDGTLVSES